MTYDKIESLSEKSRDKYGKILKEESKLANYTAFPGRDPIGEKQTRRNISELQKEKSSIDKELRECIKEKYNPTSKRG